MERQKNWKILFGAAGLFCLFLLTTNRAMAASATIGFSQETEEISVGEEVKVSVDIDTDSAIDSVEAYINYDNNVLEYLSGAEGVSGGNGTLKIADSIAEEEAAEKSYSLTFRAKKKGVCIMEFSEQPVVYEIGTQEAMSVSYEDISVRVKKASILSNNTQLDSLQVSPGTLEPSFSKTVREYKVYVGADTDTLTVSAVPSDTEATIAVNGNEGLAEGENLVVVSVTSPSGKRRKYKIYVQKEAEEPETSPETEPEKEKEKEKDTGGNDAAGTGSGKFSIREENGKIKLSNKTVYTLVDLEDSGLIPPGYVKTRLLLYGVTMTAYALEDDLENDFILFYAKKKGEDPQFYQYDREEKTMQRFSGTVVKTSENKIVVGEESDMTVNEYNEKVEQLSLVVGICAAAAAAFALGMIAFAIKYLKSKSAG